jgi:hypothetical protein
VPDLVQPLAAAVRNAAEEAADAAPRLVIETGGNQALIRKLLFTAYGRESVSVSDDKTIHIWTVSLDRRQATLARIIRGQVDYGREGTLLAAALSPLAAQGRQRWLAVGGVL